MEIRESHDPWAFTGFSIEVADTDTALLENLNTEALCLKDPPISRFPIDGALRLPELETFTYGALDEGVPIEESQSSDVEVAQTEAGEEDISIFLRFDHFYPRKNEAETWEQFWDKDFKESPLYLSEAGPKVWDAIWSTELNATTRVSPVKDSSKEAVSQCQDAIPDLFHLGLGFGPRAWTFSPGGDASYLANGSSISGLSANLTLSLIQDFGSIGVAFRTVDAFVKQVSQNHGIPRSTIAIAAGIGAIAQAARSWLIERKDNPSSVLQLQALFRLPGLLLKKLKELINRLQNLSNDNDVLNHVFSFAEEQEVADTWCSPFVLQVLQMASQSCLDSVGSLVGLGNSTYTHPQSETHPQHALNSEQEPQFPCVLPDFIQDDQKESIISAWQGLRLIKGHYKDHAIAQSTVESPNLEIRFTMDDVERIQLKANHYEASVRSFLEGKSNSSVAVERLPLRRASDEPDFDPFDLGKDQMLDKISQSYELFDGHNKLSHTGIEDEIERTISSALSGDIIREEKTLLPLSVVATASLAPLLSTQSRFINLVCLQMLFERHRLIHHLDIQNSFQLLGSGIFASRLSQALLAPDLSSAERKKGYSRAGVMGLRLGTRTTWPPASAEIRLALMGILSECYQDSFPEEAAEEVDGLPGDMSFAIRNLSENEIEDCLDPNSLAALDFLRLQYRAHPPLDTVITESILEKYDRVFRFLLRLQRVSFVANHLLSLQARVVSAEVVKLRTRFMFEARHFVRSLLMYAGTCISSTWLHFRQCLQHIKACLEGASNLDTFGEKFGLRQLEKLHEAMLDQILFDLLLKRRQQKVMDVLSEILTHVLDFARFDNETVSNIDITRAQEALKNFRAKVSLFRAVCKGLSERGDYVSQAKTSPRTSFADGSKAYSIEDQGLKTLLLMLEMNDWYEKKGN